MIDVQLREEDVVAAARAHFRLLLTRPAALIIFGLIILLLGAGIVINLAAGRQDFFPPGALAFVALMLALLWFWTVPRTARRAYRQQAGLRYPVTYEWDEAQFRLRSQAGESRLAWSDIFAWHATPDLVLIYLSGNLYHLVPAHAFASTEERAGLERLLTGHGVPTRRSGGRRR
ncbi:signal transduction histidine kinase [Sphingomonas zeicaulis]|uniref:YcxB family protein n=1 Tax=Sphingomonas zeicaulis TaxID=1632740 RepID=UPI003D19AFFC